MLSFLITVCMMPIDAKQPYCSLSATAEVESVSDIDDCNIMAQDAADQILAGQLAKVDTKHSLAVGRCMQQSELPQTITEARDYLARHGFHVEVTYY